MAGWEDRGRYSRLDQIALQRQTQSACLIAPAIKLIDYPVTPAGSKFGDLQKSGESDTFTGLGKYLQAENNTKQNNQKANTKNLWLAMEKWTEHEA